MYIRDTLYVPLRAGQSEDTAVLHQSLKSGTPLVLLQTNDATGYSQVRLQDGTVGWLQTQYLQDDPIAKDQLADVNDKLTKLEAEHQQTLLHVQDLEAQRASLAQDLKAAKAKLDDVNDQFQQMQKASANVVAIDKRNNQLRADEAQLRQRIKTLSDSNRKLESTSARDWFVRGGSIVILALLIGFWVARRIYNRNNSGWA